MSTTPTTNLNLIKNNADEPIANWRTNDNANMNALDTAIKAVQDATDTLEKARQNLNNLIGVLGKNSSNADLISKAQARANLDVAQSGGAAKTLYADEQTIAQNASLIASLQDSVSGLITKQRYHLTDSIGNKYTVPANSTIIANANVALSGYRPLGIVQSSFQESGASVGMTFSQVETDGTTVMVWRNFTSAAQTSRLQIDVLYVKS